MNAIIIGATSGIGKEIARLLVADAYHVWITGRRVEKLKAIQKTQPQAYKIVHHDVRDIQSTEALFRRIKDSGTQIDLIVYSSGTGEPNYELQWEKEVPTLETNVMGAVKVYTEAYKLFHRQGYGHLVGISSVAAIRGNRHVPAYFASKAFQRNYLESLWLKARKSKADIYVTDIVPGFVDTAMAMGSTFWMASVSKAGRQIYKAIKAKRKRVYITKRWLWVALLLRIAPAKLLLKM